MSTAKPSKVTVLEEKVVDMPRKKARRAESPSAMPVMMPAPQQAAPLPPAPMQPKKTEIPDMQILAMLNALSRILGQRLAVFLSLMGSFSLTMTAILQPAAMKLVAAASFDVLVFIPMVLWSRKL